ncbi:MAG TPA: hypothetical protein VH196_07285, partial [Terriglobales bacterium]|nr:hypothetical protein [Terriglobales bacterium]
EQALVALVGHYVEHESWDFPNTFTPPASCWNGLLLVCECPEVHARIYSFLEHLQRNHRVEDPPEQP